MKIDVQIAVNIYLIGNMGMMMVGMSLSPAQILHVGMPGVNIKKPAQEHFLNDLALS